MPHFCLLDSLKSVRAVSKVEQKLKKSEKCSTTGSKFGPATSKVDKISKSNVLTVIEQVMSSTAFGKITAVYGHIDENGRFVRKWTVQKMAITDKRSKKPVLSVNPQHNGQKFTDKSHENDGLSVKCVLITDKSAKIGSLSVNLSEILAHCPKKKKSVPSWHEFSSLFSCVRGHERSLPNLHNRVPARIPPIASKDSLDETSSPSVAQSLRTGS